MPGFEIALETSAGARLGPGPVATASRWQHVKRLDKAGTIAFDVPATDPRLALEAVTPLLAHKRVARCYGLRAGARVELGAGVVDELAVDPHERTLTASGNDLLDELATRTVGFLQLASGSSPIAIASALASIMALAPAGWSIDTTTYTGSGATVYLEFAGESVLAALIKVAEHTGEHFRLGSGRQVVWLYQQQPASGIRAEKDADPVAAEGNAGICLITSLQRTSNSHDVCTRVYPYGSGNADARITLAGTTRSAPAGYALDTTNNYLAHTANDTAGRIDRHESFKDVAKVGADAGAAGAADALFDAAYAYLRRHLEPQASYRLSVTKLDQVLEPGSTIRVVWRGVVDGTTWIAIDDDLVVLEATTAIDDTGVRTVSLQVATVDRWPQTQTSVLAGAVGQLRTLEAHKQKASAALRADTVDDTAVARLGTANTWTALQVFANALRSVANATGVIALAARRIAGQTANIVEAQDEGGAALWAIDRAGHVVPGGLAPTVTAGTGAGTAPAVSVTGNDVRGLLTITTGTAPTAGATIATVTFATAFAAAPQVFLVPANLAAKTLSGASEVYVNSTGVTTSLWNLLAGSTALTASTTYVWRYLVL